MRKYSVKIGPGRKLGADLLIAPDESKGGIAVVLHTLPPRSLGAPPHRHSREDEYFYVLEGELTAWEEGRVQAVKPGECVLKARDLLHTFWNQGDMPLRFIVIIASGGFAGFLEELDKVQPDGPFRQDDIPRIDVLNRKYGLQMDFEQIPEIIRRHGLNQ